MKESSASSTALTIAASMSYLARVPGGAEVPKESVILCDWLLAQYSPLTRLLLRGFDKAWGRVLARALESATAPGIIAHYLARKMALESLVRESSSMRQLAVLGAGFDTLALRIAGEESDRRVWEVDHPATQAWKRRGLEACHLGKPNLRLVPGDLSKREFPLDPGRDQETFWIAEGLLMYFPEAMVKEFFRTIRRISKPGSRITFTFMEPMQDGRIDFRRRSRPLHLWLKSQREPFQWGMNRDNLAVFLSDLGFHRLPISPETTLEVDRLHVGEYLALAEVLP